MSRGDLVVIVVLGDDGESAFDRGGGDQGIGELDHTVNSSDPAVRNQSRQLTITASLSAIGSAVRASASVSARRAIRGVSGIEDAELKFADRDDRHRYVVG